MKNLLTLAEIEREAISNLPIPIAGFLQSGADDEKTLRENVKAYDDNFVILPRVLKNVSTINTQLTMSGSILSVPIGFAPSSWHEMYHPDGEIATVVSLIVNN